MATCGHHYPQEGCHNCWVWIEEELREARAVLDYLAAHAMITDHQIDEAMDAVCAPISTALSRSKNG